MGFIYIIEIIGLPRPQMFSFVLDIYKYLIPYMCCEVSSSQSSLSFNLSFSTLTATSLIMFWLCPSWLKMLLSLG